MTLVVDAIFENGVFVPAERPNLRDHERVRILIVPATRRDAEAVDLVDSRRAHRVQIPQDLAHDIADLGQFIDGSEDSPCP